MEASSLLFWITNTVMYTTHVNINNGAVQTAVSIIPWLDFYQKKSQKTTQTFFIPVCGLHIVNVHYYP